METYQYTPLKRSTDIRIAAILPGKFNDPIRIEIRHEPFDIPEKEKPSRWSLKEIRDSLPKGWAAHETVDGRVIFCDRNERSMGTSWDHPNPEIDRNLYDPINETQDPSFPVFEALSYAWGSPEEPQMVLIASKLKQSGLSVTRNLAEALRHLRYTEQPRDMWIDAICINQEDRTERSQQVQRMSQIYAFASRVVAWLGPGSSSCSLAFSALEEIGHNVEITRDDYLLPSPGCNHPDWFGITVPLPYGMDVLDAIRDMCQLEWFTRLWVLQEIHLGGLNSVLKSGADEIPWCLFRHGIRCILSKATGIPAKLRTDISTVYKMCHFVHGMQFHVLLHLFHRRVCSDKRDKIYGLMSLAHLEITNRIRVDYSETQTPLETYKQTFLACLDHQRRLGLLPYAGQRRLLSTSQSWPSWVPDWSQNVNRSTGHYLGYSSSGISAARANHMSPDSLQVVGLPFTRIESVGEELTGRQFSSLADTLRTIGIKHLQESKYPPGGTLLEAYVRALVADVTNDRLPGLGYPTLKEVIEELAIPTVVDGAFTGGGLPGFWTAAVERWLYNHRLFKAGNSYIGTICGKPEPGDEIFVILGCDVPMVLRPTQNGEYAVIGDCYVHGIMDDEAVLGGLPHPWRVLVKDDANGLMKARYYNDDTGDETSEDPRLAEVLLPPEWEPIDREWTTADPLYCKWFKHRETGEVINSDPRLFPEALRERGVPLKTITLV
ncbi:HET-domain-containing protein [Xylariomycetidae sp. FL2044]|nr:HET-domain-containing protein [Xylariomycetidae sp. FL2044]